uniref:Uncharacterized protein n=1 Tax=Fagus sylvatica TaxID=28930 RepID=A0A2N9IY59_FAGSY
MDQEDSNHAMGELRDFMTTMVQSPTQLNETMSTICQNVKNKQPVNQDLGSYSLFESLRDFVDQAPQVPVHIEQPPRAQEEETVNCTSLTKIIDSILKDQKEMHEELAHLSKVAYSSLQISLTNQTMISTLCKNMHDSTRLEELTQPKSLTRKEEVSRSTSYPSESLYRRLTVSKGINEPIPSPKPKSYNFNAHCEYHQVADHDINECIALRHAVQDLITIRPLLHLRTEACRPRPHYHKTIASSSPSGQFNFS